MRDSSQYRIYIVLSKTGTNVAKLIRLYTKERYSHASLSFDANLNTMYSFARRGVHNPLNAGFMEERLDRGILALDKRVECAVYCLELSKENYVLLKSIVADFLIHQDEYRYNIKGLFSAAINRPYSRPKRFFCSQFVAWILGKAGITVSLKDYALTRPEDIRQALDLYKIYEGRLHDYAAYRDAHYGLDNLSILQPDYLTRDYKKQKHYRMSKYMPMNDAV